MKLLAQETVRDIFGKISPPPGPRGLNEVDAVSGLSRLLGFSLRVIFFVAAITVLVFVFWGTLDWIGSGGDKEKLDRARSKITNAFLGSIILAIALSLYLLFTSDLLGIVKRTKWGGFEFILPSLRFEKEPDCLPPGTPAKPGERLKPC